MSATSPALSLTRAAHDVAQADRELQDAVSHWLDIIRTRLDLLAVSLREHIEMTESTDGLFASVLSDAPHLSTRVDRLTREHYELAETITMIHGAASSQGASSDADQVKAVHESVHSLILTLDRHMHESCRITHDAVSVDLGGPVG